MTSTTKFVALFVLGLAATALTFQSCKKKFDEPPLDEYPVLVPNATIGDVKALHTVGDTAVLIQDSLVIEGIVVSSDEAGNFFKQLIVQDDNSGIEIRIEESNLYNKYPVGRKVYIKCKGLYVGSFQGNHQLTINGNGDRIPGNLLGRYVIGGALNQPVNPKVLTITEIKNGPQYRNMLVQLAEAQFSSADVEQTYADAIGQASLNREVNDCNGNAVILRSSGFASFASRLTPAGKGTLTAVYTNFGSDAQLVIRDTKDVAFDDPRCTVSVGGNLITIAALRAVYTGSSVGAPSNSKVQGYVVSDRSTNNLIGQNMVVMDATGALGGGIVVRFSSNHTFNEGDYIEFQTDGGTLSEFNGLMQLEGISSGNINVLSTGNAVPPTVVTISNLLANAESYESTLIQVQNASITNGVFSGTRTLSDGTGSVDLFTRFQASFANDAVPCGNLTVTCILGQFTTYQVQLRNPVTDISGGSPCGSSAVETKLSDIRAIGAGNMIGNDIKIKGIVISDKNTLNIVDQNLVIQDTSGGIVLRFSSAHSYNLGDELEVIVSNLTVSEFNGLMQISGLVSSAVTVTATAQTVTPRVATITQILANAEAWESTLVQIANVTLPTGTFSGTKVLNDGTGNLDLFTRTQATFSTTTMPTGTVTVTGYIGQFDTTAPYDSGYQISIRNTADVQ